MCDGLLQICSVACETGSDEMELLICYIYMPVRYFCILLRGRELLQLIFLRKVGQQSKKNKSHYSLCSWSRWTWL